MSTDHESGRSANPQIESTELSIHDSLVGMNGFFRAVLRPFFFVIFVLAGTLSVMAQYSPQRSFAELKALFESTKSELMVPIKELEAGYAFQLNKLLDEVTSAGKLEDALIVKAEIDNFRTGEEGAEAETLPELERLQEIYSSTRERRIESVQKEQLKLMTAYKDQLASLQSHLTREKKLDQAVEVKSTIERLEAELKVLEEQVGSPPVGERTQFRVGSPSEVLTTEEGAEGLASVEVAGAEFRDLEVGAKCFSDAEYKWVNVPESLKGTKFSVLGKHSHTLSFTVGKSGLVFIAVGNEFSEKSGTGTDWEKSALDEKGLRRSGWRYLREFDELSTDGSGNQLVFYRECEKGETHSIRTAKYSPPFLLIR